MSTLVKKPPKPIGLAKTLDLLAKTPNEAAVDVLVGALDCEKQAVADGALRAILDRRTPVGQKEVLSRLQSISPAWKAILNEKRGRMNVALRDAVLGADHQMCVNGCQAILWFGEYDLAPALITAAEDDTHHSADLAAQTLLALANSLYDELSGPGDYKSRRDPQLVRRNVTGALEASVQRFVKHRRGEIVTAFLVLSGRENSTLKLIMQDPHHAAYVCLLDALLHSPRSGILRLLLSFLEDPHAPSAAVSVLSRRSDRPFIDHLLRKVGYEPSSVAAQNLRRMENISWLRGDTALLDDLDDAAQHSVVQIAMASGMKRLEVFGTIKHLLLHGKLGGRRAAAVALAQFNGADANSVALAALNDSDPRVLAAIVSQLRQRGIPGALSKLVEMIDSPHELVRSTARLSLSEFSYDRFLAAYDMLEDEVRQSTGVLVKKINPHAVSATLAELETQSRTRRLRAIGIAMAMGAVRELEGAIVPLVDDEDHVIRAEAARALGQCDTPTARAALDAALGDRSVIVQETAAHSLELLNAAAARQRKLDRQEKQI